MNYSNMKRIKFKGFFFFFGEKKYIYIYRVHFKINEKCKITGPAFYTSFNT